jgi:MFS family permease
VSSNGYYKWLVVAMLWFVCLFNYADRQAVFSVFRPIQAELKLTDQELGYVGSAFMWVYALASPLAGLVGDRVRRKTLILGGLLFWSLITAATALATEYWHLLLCRALEGFGEAFYFPASLALISEYHGPETRSRAMGLHQSSVYAGTILGGYLAGWLAEYYSWRSGFWVFGGLGVVLAAALVTLLKEPPLRRSADRVSLGDLKETVAYLFTNRIAVALMAIFVGANFVASVFLTWMPTFLYDKFNMKLHEAGFTATVYFQVPSALGALSGGVLADRLARRYTGGRMLSQAVGLSMGVPFLFFVGQAGSVPMLILVMIGLGYCKGLYDANIWASLYDVVKPERRASSVGIMNGIGWLGAGLAAVTLPVAAKYYGMSDSISATSVIYLVLGMVLYLLSWIRQRYG